MLPESCRKAFTEAHSVPLAGHFGTRKTIGKLTQCFYRPQISKDVGRWTKECLECQRHNKGTTSRSPLQPLSTIEEPWQRVAIDIVGPLPRTANGYRYILTIMDFASRYPEAVPLRRVDTRTVADALIEVFSRYGVPDELLSDNGSWLLWKKF